MSEKKQYSEYLKETVDGTQVCVYCKKTEQEIADRLDGHAGWCKWRRDMEDMEKASEKETKDSLSGSEYIVRRHGR
jgi:peptide methionine sulfoxide reductase MsrB